MHCSRVFKREKRIRTSLEEASDVAEGLLEELAPVARWVANLEQALKRTVDGADGYAGDGLGNSKNRNVPLANASLPEDLDLDRVEELVSDLSKYPFWAAAA